MAGGIGSRFWPMSTIDRPKQFIDVLGCGKLALLGYYMSKIPGMDSEAAVMSAVKEHSAVIGYVFIALAVACVGYLLYKGLRKS